MMLKPINELVRGVVLRVNVLLLICLSYIVITKLLVSPFNHQGLRGLFLFVFEVQFVLISIPFACLVGQFVKKGKTRKITLFLYFILINIPTILFGGNIIYIILGASVLMFIIISNEVRSLKYDYLNGLILFISLVMFVGWFML